MHPIPAPCLLLAASVAVVTTLAAAAAAPAAVTPAAPVKLGRAARDTITRALLQDRADTETWLRSGPTSYLATILRRDFGAKTHMAIGSAPDNDVVIAGDSVAAHHARVTVVGDSFRVEALDPGVRVRLGRGEAREAVVGPSSIGIGRYTVRLSHQRYPALIVFDPQSPRYREYKGLAYYPVDLAYRYELPLTPDPSPDTVVIQSTRGNRRNALRVGWFDFRVKGRACRLEVNRLLEPGVGEQGYSVFFRDATTGKQTYPVGRYIDPEPLPDGRFRLDFNRAYNPACAFSEHYNCPIPRDENVLKVAIRAGEKDAHYLH